MPVKVFLSYQHESKPLVLEFQNKLKEYGIEGWIDVIDIAPGESLIERISEGISNETSAVIAFISRKALDSKWVNEELRQAKTREIEEENFILIPILLGNLRVNELPPYLRGTKCVLWENEKPKEEENIHLAFLSIVNSLYKRYIPDSKEICADYKLLVEGLQDVVVSYGHQRRIRRVNNEELIYGEFRKKFSKILIALIAKYHPINPGEKYIQFCDCLNMAIHADIALLDWSLGHADVDFQENIINDMLEILARTNTVFGPVEAVNEIHTKIAQYKDNILFQMEHLTPKTDFEWSVNIRTIFYKYSLFHNDEDLLVAETRKIIFAIKRDPYLAWKNAPWPY